MHKKFIPTPDSMITKDGVFPLPEAWREMVNFDVKEYWKRERIAQFDACTHDEEEVMLQGSGLLPPDPDPDEEIAWLERQEADDADDELPMDTEWTLPGYDPDDFKG